MSYSSLFLHCAGQAAHRVRNIVRPNMLASGCASVAPASVKAMSIFRIAFGHRRVPGGNKADNARSAAKKITATPYASCTYASHATSEVIDAPVAEHEARKLSRCHDHMCDSGHRVNRTFNGRVFPSPITLCPPPKVVWGAVG